MSFSDPFFVALVRFLHIAGAVIGIGGLIYLGFAVLPAAGRLSEERQTFMTSLRRRGRLVTISAVLLLLVTGFFRLAPGLGGVGWLGFRGIYTAILHVKILLALFIFHLGLSLMTTPKDEAAASKRPARARLAGLLGLVVVLLATIHHGHAMPGTNVSPDSKDAVQPSSQQPQAPR